MGRTKAQEAAAAAKAAQQQAAEQATSSTPADAIVQEAPSGAGEPPMTTAPQPLEAQVPDGTISGPPQEPQPGQPLVIEKPADSWTPDEVRTHLRGLDDDQAVAYLVGLLEASSAGGTTDLVLDLIPLADELPDMSEGQRLVWAAVAEHFRATPVGAPAVADALGELDRAVNAGSDLEAPQGPSAAEQEAMDAVAEVRRLEAELNAARLKAGGPLVGAGGYTGPTPAPALVPDADDEQRVSERYRGALVAIARMDPVTQAVAIARDTLGPNTLREQGIIP